MDFIFINFDRLKNIIQNENSIFNIYTSLTNSMYKGRGKLRRWGTQKESNTSILLLLTQPSYEPLYAFSYGLDVIALKLERKDRKIYLASL
jgi:hypothetical protein